MSFLTRTTKKRLEVLYDTKPEINSVTFSNEQEIKKIGKLSRICLFITWLAHRITFGHFVRNKKLDEVTLTLLKDIQGLHNFTETDKNLIIGAYRVLEKIIDENGGSKRNLVTEMAQKIASIPAVKEITVTAPKKTNIPAVNPPASIKIPAVLSQEKPSQLQSQTPIRSVEKIQPIETKKEQEAPIGKPKEELVLAKIEEDAEKKDFPKFSPEKIHELFSNETEIISKFQQQDEKTKAQWIAFALFETMTTENNLNSFWVEANQASQEIWQEASQILSSLHLNYPQQKFVLSFEKFEKQGLFNLLEKQYMILFEEQSRIANPGFCLHFFAHLFSRENEKQKEFLETVNPEFFELFVPSHDKYDSEDSLWIKFLKTLEACEPNDHRKAIIDNVASFLQKNNKLTLLMDMSPAFLNASLEHLKEKYSVFCVAVIVKTNQMDKPEHEAILNETFKNSLLSQEFLNAFFDYFEDVENKDFTDIVNLINWLTKKKKTLNIKSLLDHIEKKFQPTDGKIFHPTLEKFLEALEFNSIYSFVSPKLNIEKPVLFLECLPFLNFIDANMQTNLYKMDIREWYKKSKAEETHPSKYSLKNLTPAHYSKLFPNLVNIAYLKDILIPILEDKQADYLKVFFEHFEKEPWKLVVLKSLLTSEEIDSLSQWANAQTIVHTTPSNESRLLPLYPQSKTILNLQAQSNYVDFLDKFFKCKTVSSLPEIPKTHEQLKNRLLFFIRKASSEQLIQYFLKIHPNQVALALYDEVGIGKLQEAFSKENPSPKALSRLLFLANEIKNKLDIENKTDNDTNSLSDPEVNDPEPKVVKNSVKEKRAKFENSGVKAPPFKLTLERIDQFLNAIQK